MTIQNSTDNPEAPITVIPFKSDPRDFRQEKITHVIDVYLAKLEDYWTAYSITVPHLIKTQEKSIETLNSKLEGLAKSSTLDDGSIMYEASSARTASQLSETIRLSSSIVNSKAIPSLIKSLFIGIFSEYDAFIGNLLKAIYSQNHSLFKNISREIKLTELLEFQDIETVKVDMLEKEIDSLRRESYINQFTQLETTFSIKLKDFEEWPEFVEMSQRRNLFTHTEGKVSAQYLMLCKKEKCHIPPDVKVGSELDITTEYFSRAILILSKVGFMLAHTLWKKSLPNKAKIAADALNNSIYLLMKRQRWSDAAEFAKFGLSEPQLKNIDAITKKIRHVNTAITLKKLNRNEEVIRILDSQDWSGCIREFKLANAILRGHNPEAAQIMLEIGKTGELINEISYHDWPLFIDFRDTPEFQSAYEKIYGTSFIQKASENAHKINQEIQHPTSLDNNLEITEDVQDKPAKKRKVRKKEKE